MESPIDTIPDVLLMEIFRRLDSKSSQDSCSLVCKHWFYLEALSRNTIKIPESGNTESVDVMIRSFARRFINVENVHICRLADSSPSKSGKRWCIRHRRAGNCLSDSALGSVAYGFPNLKMLSLVMCSTITDLGLRSFAEKCKSLKKLDLQGCYIGDDGLAAVGESCNSLEDLSLRRCEGLTDTGLVQLCVGCRRTLRSLGIAACTKITDVSLQAVGSHCKSLGTLLLDSDARIGDEGFLAVAEGCQQLKVLTLRRVNISGEALEAVGHFCLSLELLALYFFIHMTDSSLYAIGNGCKMLKNLTLSDCRSITSKALNHIAVRCPELMRIEVNGCYKIGSTGFESIGKFCTRLSELELLYCPRMEANALSKIGAGCKFLEVLHLVDCPAIDDESMCIVARNCKDLRKLHIRQCYEVGSRGIIAVGENCKYLTDLSLRLCDRVGDEALIAIGQGCSLKYLNVSCCFGIGDAGIVAIARSSPQLISLDMSGLQKVSDKAMLELGEKCPQLKSIVISHCQKITDVGLQSLAMGCTLLESCYMTYCPGITHRGISAMIKTCTRLKEIMAEKSKRKRIRSASRSTINCLCIGL